MKLKPTLPLLALLTLLPLTPLGWAQTPPSAPQTMTQPVPRATALPAPVQALTRAEVKADRDTWMKTHRWSEEAEDWVLKSGQQPPPSTLSRAAARAERDLFLSKNRWVSQLGWQPITPAPRNLGTMTRAQVRAETREFMRTHRYDDALSVWVLRERPLKPMR